ncbi:MAG: ribonuclease HII [Patescibacteria group bacterium]
MAKRIKYIIGIDEVGRGPLAGPVVVAALAVPTKLRIKNAELRKNFKSAKLRDSKKLSLKQREIWFEYVKKHPKIFYAIASVSPKVIDKINISNAANLAATRAFQKLVNSYAIASVLTRRRAKIFLDGGLYFPKFLNSKSYILNSRTIIRGDEKIPAIALASIVAKVTRDRMMRKLHKKYPQYGFDKHKGYGTKKHFKAIRKHGLSPIHRKSFRIK